MVNLIKEIFSKTVFFNIYPHPYLRKDYYFKWNEDKPSPSVIFMMDSRYTMMGFADCLRGMISSYAFAKAKGMPFKIDFKVPFHLDEYLIPNDYDWEVDESEISYNYKYSSPIWVMDRDRGRIFKFPFPRARQYHLYTNVNIIGLVNKKFRKNYDYTVLYKELFRPSEALQKRIDEISQDLGNSYISVSFRFSTLLGDFEDCINSPLPEKKQKEYIKRCKKKLEEIHLANNSTKVFVTSDSSKFIDSLKDLPWVHFIQGKRGQFKDDGETDVHMLTFLDFFIISGAKKVFMAHTGKMYRSNFAKSAALTTGTAYEELSF